MSNDNIDSWGGGAYSGWFYSALSCMFIGLESPERQEYARPRILQFAFISFSISSQLSGLLSDCHMLFQQDELTMDFTQHFPLYLHSTNFSQWPNNALNNTVVDFALLIYTRIFLWYINKRGSKDMCILKCNRKCQSNVQIDFTTTLIAVFRFLITEASLVEEHGL